MNSAVNATPDEAHRLVERGRGNHRRIRIVAASGRIVDEVPWPAGVSAEEMRRRVYAHVLERGDMDIVRMGDDDVPLTTADLER